MFLAGILKSLTQRLPYVPGTPKANINPASSINIFIRLTLGSILRYLVSQGKPSLLSLATERRVGSFLSLMLKLTKSSGSSKRSSTLRKGGQWLHPLPMAYDVRWSQSSFWWAWQRQGQVSTNFGWATGVEVPLTQYSVLSSIMLLDA